MQHILRAGAYVHGELRALWEWLDTTGIKIAALGINGPLPGTTTEAMQLVLSGEQPPQHQVPCCADARTST